MTCCCGEHDVTLHIQFCLDEIDCEIEALDQGSLSEVERRTLGEHISSIRMLLAGCETRRAALLLAIPNATPAAIPSSASMPAAIAERATANSQPVQSAGPVEALPPAVAPIPAPIRLPQSHLNATPSITSAATAIAERATTKSQPEQFVVQAEALPPAVAPIPAPIRLVIPAPVDLHSAELSPTKRTTIVMALRSSTATTARWPITRIAASLLLVVGLGVLVGMP